jgi:hypothetical protein
MKIPLWLSVPVLLALWLSSWITGMDPTGSHQESTLLWAITAIATALVLLQSLIKQA